MTDRIINWNLEPEIFWITETFPLKYYGIFFMTGILIALYVEKRIYIKENLPIENLDKLFFYVFGGIFLGARLGHCIFYDPTYYFEHPVEILLPIKQIGESYQFIGFQGLASHGGAIGVLIGVGIYCKKHKIIFLETLDKIAIVAPIVAAFIRFGNFMNSEIYGKPTDGTWGVIFQRSDLIPRHPTQLYEAFSYLFIFWILMLTYRKAYEFKGEIIGLALVLIFTARFVIEFFKENQVGFEDGLAINMGQILSIPFVIIGLLLVISLKSYVKRR